MRRTPALIGTLLLAGAGAMAGAEQPDAETQTRANAESWEALGRADLAQLALDKLLLTRPNDAELLFEIGQLDLRLNQLGAARTLLQRMQQTLPGAPETRQMARAYDAASKDRLRLSSIRRLLELNRDAEAMSELAALYPDGAPHGDLGVEYYRILGEQPGQRRKAREGLAEIAKRHPRQPRYRIALAELMTRDTATRTEGLAMLEQAAKLSREPSPTLLDAWRRGLLRAPHDARSRASAREYLVRKPTETSIAAWLAQRETGTGLRTAPAVPSTTRPEDRFADRLSNLLLAGKAGEVLQQLDGRPASQDRGDEPGTQLATLRARALQSRAAQEQALGNAIVARNTLAEAQRLAPDDPWLLLDRVTALRVNGDQAAADRLVDQSLARIATAAAAPKPAGLATTLDTAESRRLRAIALGVAADAEDARGHSGAALALIESAQTLTPGDPWLRYRLAKRYVALGVPDEARALMTAGVAETGTDRRGEMLYATALLLASLDDIDGARAALAGIPAASRSEGVIALERRMTVAAARTEADRLRAAGQRDAAASVLAAAEDAAVDGAASDPDLLRSLASGWRALDQPKRGLALLDRAAQGGGVTDAPELRVLRAELLDDAGEEAPLASTLLALETDPTLNAAQRRRVSAVADRQALREIAALRKAGKDTLALARLDAALAREPDSSALRDARAELQLDHQRYAAALADLRTVVAQSDEDWRVKRANGRIKDIETLKDGFIALGPSLRDKAGSPGRSQFSNVEIPFEADYAIDYGKHAFLHADRVSTSSGTLPSNYDDAALFGQVQARGPQSLIRFPNGAKQDADGTALAFGYRTETLRADIGSTPVGFPVQDLVGGLRYNERLSGLNITIDAARRPITSSALSYAGAYDPATGQVWGGVRDNRVLVRVAQYGPRLSLSTSLQGGVATGRRVPDNEHVQASASANWRVLDRPTQRVFVGVSGNYWHYGKNLSEYTFGHGGYYSPQQYLSVGLPMEWNGRLGRFTYTLKGSVSLSQSKIDSAPFYPGDAGLQALAVSSPLPAGFSAPVYGGRSGFGFGRSLSGNFEYALSPRWSFGGTFDIDRSAYYSPNFFSLYLRRSFQPHDLLRAFPPSPPQPYSDY